mmetsp:Transcript_117084/g.233327  ORF Transcript_117084/g.233327 Transcript_117084/m.233327 type:complete len:87 (-) Transcript_117084:114-374(-)
MGVRKFDPFKSSDVYPAGLDCSQQCNQWKQDCNHQCCIVTSVRGTASKTTYQQCGADGMYLRSAHRNHFPWLTVCQIILCTLRLGT